MLRINGIDQLASAAGTLRDCAGPVVIDVRIDHEIVLAKQDLVSAMAPPPAPTPATPHLRVID